jgi:proteasome lid subunit RPN8/RPN11
MLILSAELHDEIRAHGVRSYPLEGCGLLVGTTAGDVNTVAAVRPVSNVWPVEAEKIERFEIDPQELLAVELEAMQDDLGVIGVFHSHPDHPPIASPRDLAWAGWDVYSYLITEITAAGAGASRSWKVLPERSGFVEEVIETVGSVLETPGGSAEDK